MAERPLRVLGVSTAVFPSGAERVLLRCARYGRDTGAGRWTIASPPGAFADAVRADGVDHVELPETKLGDGPLPLAGTRLVANTARAGLRLRRLAADYDVVVVNSVMSLPAVRIGVPGRSKVVWLVHDVITRPGLRRIAKASAPVVDLAVGVSHSSAHLAGRLGLPTAVVHNGVHAPVPPARPEGDAPIVGVNAMLTSWKGQKEFLAAMRHVSEPFEIELLGGTFPKDGEYESMLRSMADEPPLAGRVRLLGHVDDPIEAMRRWSIVVSASIEPEAGPLAVLEAMSIGLPVIVTNHGGALEIAGDVALRVEPGDVRAMAAAVEQLLRCPDERRRRGQQGRAIVEERFTLEQSSERFAATLRSVASP